jgi:hypothetical protein
MLPRSAMTPNPDKTQDRLERFFWPLVFGFTVLAALARVPALDPPALWYDDLWVALSGKAEHLSDLFSYTRSTPIGFTFLTAAMVRLVPDPELSAQLLPFLFSLAVAPLGAWLVRRLGGGCAAALAAAVLLLASPVLAQYGVRVKQFSADAFCSLALAALALPCLEHPGRFRPFARLLLCSCLLSLLSYTSFFVSFPLVFCVLAAQAKVLPFRPASLRPFAAALLGWAAFFPMYYFLLLRHQRRGDLVASWEGKEAFLPWKHPEGIPAYLRENVLGNAVYGAFDLTTPLPAPLGIAGALAGLAAAGLAFLWIQSRWRPLAAALALLFIQALVLSALRLYPLGHGRVDLYLHVWIVLLAVLGLGWAWDRFARLSRFWALPVLALLFLWRMPGFGEPRVAYHPQTQVLGWLRQMEQLRDGKTVVLLNWQASFPAAYYTDWKVRMRPKKTAQGMLMRSEDPRLIIPIPPKDYLANPSSLDPKLQAALDLGPERIAALFFSEERITAPTLLYYQSRGYRITEREDFLDSSLVVLQRGPEPAPPP